MKILQLNKLYFPWTGGIETVVKQIFENLNDDYIEVDVLAANEMKGEGSRVYCTNKFGKVFKTYSFGIFLSSPISPVYIFYYYKFMKEYDIIHLHSPHPLGEFAICLFGKKKDSKLIITVHADIRNTRFKRIYFVYKYLLKRLYKKADFIVVTAPENYLSNKLLKKYTSKIKLVPLSWVNDFQKLNFDISIIDKLKINLKYDFTFVYLGRLIYYKGIEFLIKAMQGIQANLLVIGTGILNTELQSLTERLSLNDSVFFLGHLTDLEIAAIFKISNAFVLPSISEAEAFGIVQLEAMKSGLPIINTDLKSGVIYASIDKLTGETIPPGSATDLNKVLNKFVNNPDLVATYSKNAVKRASYFSPEIMINRYKRLYFNNRKLNYEEAKLWFKSYNN